MKRICCPSHPPPLLLLYHNTHIQRQWQRTTYSPPPLTFIQNINLNYPLPLSIPLPPWDLDSNLKFWMDRALQLYLYNHNFDPFNFHSYTLKIRDAHQDLWFGLSFLECKPQYPKYSWNDESFSIEHVCDFFSGQGFSVFLLFILMVMWRSRWYIRRHLPSRSSVKSIKVFFTCSPNLNQNGLLNLLKNIA